MKKGLIIVFVLLSAILVSGCTQTGAGITVNADNGIVITEFSTDFARIEDTESVNLFLDFENQGGTTASNVKVDLFGASWMNDNQPETKEYDSLSPPDITIEPAIPGDFKQVSWYLRAPNLPEGVASTYNLIARVKYDYKTSATAHMTAFSDDEYKRRLQKGEVLSGVPISVANSDGPVKIAVSGEHPIKVDVPSEKGQTVSYRIDFMNVGEGVPITGGEDGLIMGSIKIQGEGVEFSDCLGVTQGDRVDLVRKDRNTGNPRQATEPVKLRRGESITKPCEVVIDRLTWGDKPEDAITLIFKLEYEYYTEKSVPLTVVGTIPQ